MAHGRRKQGETRVRSRSAGAEVSDAAGLIDLEQCADSPSRFCNVAQAGPSARLLLFVAADPERKHHVGEGPGGRDGLAVLGP